MADYRDPAIVTWRGPQVTMSWKDEAADFGRLNPLAYHPFVQGVGDECATCGDSRFNSTHFNGDARLAQAAAERHRKVVAEREEWQDAIHAGSYVQVRDDHPREELRGRTGTVQGDPFMGSTSMTSRGRGTEQKMASVKFAPPHVQVLTLPVRMLQPSVRFTEVPTFDSPEEADKWLEDTAKEMGVSLDPLVPRFTDPAEADEWMRRQAGDPYVPGSFQGLDGTIPSDSKINDRIFKLLNKAIPPSSAPASWTKTNPLLAIEVQRVVEQLKRGETAMLTGATTAPRYFPMATLACQFDGCGYVVTGIAGSTVQHRQYLEADGTMKVDHRVV